jgi:putative peptidoglycan lipid II flippase
MFAYLGRDVLVRVFYALGDGNTPFRISILNIFLNAILDYILVKPFSTPGLVLATVGVNIISMVMLLYLLDRKLNGLPWQEWIWPFLSLTVGSLVAGLASWGTFQGCQHLGTGGLLVQLVQLCLAGLVGLGFFAAIASRLNLPEVDIFVLRLRQRLRK